MCYDSKSTMFNQDIMREKDHTTLQLDKAAQRKRVGVACLMSCVSI